MKFCQEPWFMEIFKMIKGFVSVELIILKLQYSASNFWKLAIMDQSMTFQKKVYIFAHNSLVISA